ncbi:MAG4940 family membrane protein [[Mycoplasma] collis]|uniref:MAG4940 family membrane protein n=1 Tax=[Mycoplasma] collis TaxID=2127 RepID=UPI00051BEB5F|nr:hypothetical protein [[Mycoplasma] collis]
MTNFEKLNTFFNKDIFIIEIISSLFLSYFIFVGKYLITKKKKNNLFFALWCAVSTFIALIITWSIQTFIMKVQSHVYLNFINVLIQSIFQGVKKNFSGFFLLKGLPYILSAQIIGTFLGIIFVYFTVYGFEKYTYKNNLSLIQYSTRKINDLNIVYWKDLFKYKEIKNSKFFIKELIFLIIFIISVFFINYINDVKFEINVVWKTIFMFVILTFILIFASEFDFFMFSVWLSLAFLINGAFTRKVTKNEIINFFISFILTIIITIIVSLSLLLFANKAKINFSLA